MTKIAFEPTRPDATSRTKGDRAALAILFLPVEATFALIVALCLLSIRFIGLVPWTVVVSSGGRQTVEKYRNLIRAVRRVRSVNQSRKIAVSLF